MRKQWMLAAVACAIFAQPALAQESDDQQGPPAGPPIDMEDSVFNGDWVTIGIGAGLSPSYSGSDDYVVFPLPVVTGSFGGVDFSPRPAGLAVDFIPDERGKTGITLGIAARLRSDRVDQIEDPVVKALGELDRAVEVGPTVGVSFPGVLNPFDSVSFTVDTLWDVAGAHGGMTVNPSVTYFTPLSRGAAASFSLSTTYVDDDFADYYYTVSPAQSLSSGLPAFTADGGIQSAGANLFLAFDLDGNAMNGGVSLVAIGGYSRLFGDAKNTPFTSIRGSANQFLIGGGIAYTF
ncbi:MipA/OmpV family protein [Parerythrobacter jejuensis]|uniref:MipA/OmpV family protein n=1 Tax=Parerythrobacter jejuensis TaxID=795812 RepID=A0A845AUE0_9SPHN|nr:MipA/OmpV family protein [Parerythrobacter jejuensis]MXP30359.1 MipA/OmpV family protein [Parerythrobacter jejuensis]MXP33119.1 MipA/OmpV family protein [Parerythrobacter jejuensis]